MIARKIRKILWWRLWSWLLLALGPADDRLVEDLGMPLDQVLFHLPQRLDRLFGSYPSCGGSQLVTVGDVIAAAKRKAYA